MSLAQTVLVLFDIDGTLVDTTGAGVRGMNTAFERLHGRPAALSGVAVAGRTDLAILTEWLDWGFAAESAALKQAA